eukprot:m51a1_g5395 hypothetical protein (313) ;mRNA; r:42322-43397
MTTQSAPGCCVYATAGEGDAQSVRLLCGTPPAGTSRSLEQLVLERLVRRRASTYVVGVAQQGQDEIPEDTPPARVTCLARSVELDGPDPARRPQCIVCFLLPTIPQSHDILEAFHTELGAFCESARALVVAACAPGAPEAAAQALLAFLSPWHSACVESLPRSVIALGDRLPEALHAAVRGLASVYAGALQAEDCRRFSETLLVKRCAEAGEAVAPGAPFVAWASQLIEAAADPVRTLKLCTRIKLEIMHELNGTQKTLGAAATSHHALYQAYASLRESELRDLLMEMLEKEDPYDTLATMLKQSDAPVSLL